jgi:hypothetical protein
MSEHAVEEVVTTRNEVMIGCKCGWTHSEKKGFDATAARKAVRAAHKAHKAAAEKE